MKIILSLILAVALSGVSVLTRADEGHNHEQMMKQAATAKSAEVMSDMNAKVAPLPPLPAGVVDANNTLCPISGKPVAGANFVIYKGKRYRLCCNGCKKMFLKNPEKYLEKMKEKAGA